MDLEGMHRRLRQARTVQPGDAVGLGLGVRRENHGGVVALGHGPGDAQIRQDAAEVPRHQLHQLIAADGGIAQNLEGLGMGQAVENGQNVIVAWVAIDEQFPRCHIIEPWPFCTP